MKKQFLNVRLRNQFLKKIVFHRFYVFTMKHAFFKSDIAVDLTKNVSTFGGLRNNYSQTRWAIHFAHIKEPHCAGSDIGGLWSHNGDNAHAERSERHWQWNWRIIITTNHTRHIRSSLQSGTVWIWIKKFLRNTQHDVRSVRYKPIPAINVKKKFRNFLKFQKNFQKFSKVSKFFLKSWLKTE